MTTCKPFLTQEPVGGVPALHQRAVASLPVRQAHPPQTLPGDRPLPSWLFEAATTGPWQAVALFLRCTLCGGRLPVRQLTSPWAVSSVSIQGTVAGAFLFHWDLSGAPESVVNFAEVKCWQSRREYCVSKSVCLWWVLLPWGPDAAGTSSVVSQNRWWISLQWGPHHSRYMLCLRISGEFHCSEALTQQVQVLLCFRIDGQFYCIEALHTAGTVSVLSENRGMWWVPHEIHTRIRWLLWRSFSHNINCFSACAKCFIPPSSWSIKLKNTNKKDNQLSLYTMSSVPVVCVFVCVCVISIDGFISSTIFHY